MPTHRTNPPAGTTIRIDMEVYNLLRDYATPFTDTPNMVLRRALGIDPDNEPSEEEKNAVD